MRKPIEKLVWELYHEKDRTVTLARLAEKYGEPMERIMDALDVIKIARHEVSIIPPIPWHET